MVGSSSICCVFVHLLVAHVTLMQEMITVKDFNAVKVSASYLL